MRASEFEFRHRLWLFLAMFGVFYVPWPGPHLSTGLWLLHHCGAAGLPPRVALRVVFLAAAAGLLSSAFLRTWGAAYLTSGVVHDSAIRSDRLVADGPFRFVRHPLYFGSLFLALGFGLFAQPAGFLVLVAAMLFVILRLIGREEWNLECEHGAGYLAYKTRVPMLLPSLYPRVPPAGGRPRWGQAFLGEALIWAFVLMMLLAAYTGSLRSAWIWAATFGFVAVSRLLRRARAAPPPVA